MEQHRIGDILVKMEYGGMPVNQGNHMPKFRCDTDSSGDAVEFTVKFEPLEQYREQLLRSDYRSYEVYRHGNEELLIYRWGNQLHGFAIWPDQFRASFSPAMKEQPAIFEDWFFSVCAFHRQLLQRGACVLHSSYVDIGGEALLFTGPSNIGKSTQANLWVEHANARVINGDRTLLRKRGGVWHAFGYPCCGTSGICINETMPLGAIVVLAQAAENRVEELSPGQKIRALASAMELYPWDQSEITMAFDVAQHLIPDVPVVKLYCRPDADAVTVLKKYLEAKKHAGI